MPLTGPRVGAIAQKDRSKIGQLLHNDIEKVALPVYPQVLQLREAFESAGVLGTMMSGSGPTVFALCMGVGPERHSVPAHGDARLHVQNLRQTVQWLVAGTRIWG